MIMGSPPYLSPASRRTLGRLGSRFAGSMAGTLGRMTANKMFSKRSYAKNYLRGRARPLSKTPHVVARYGLSKRTFFDVRSTTGFNFDDLSMLNVSAITKGSGINQRERDEISLRGVKVSFRGLDNTSAGNYSTGHWAIIQVKQVPDYTTAYTTTELNKDFFRGSLGSRNSDFSNVALANHKATYSINSDKFHVYARGDFSCQSTAANYAGHAAEFHKYVPVKEKVEYDASGEPINPVIFVYWFLSVSGNTTIPSASQVKGQFTCQVYYRDLV